jgi:hypothetical protein
LRGDPGLFLKRKTMSKTKEDILGPSQFPHDNLYHKVEAVKAMDEYAQQQVNEFKEKLKEKVKISYDLSRFFEIIDES